MLRDFLRSTRATSGAEYAVLLGLLSVAVVAAAWTLGGTGAETFDVADKAISAPNRASRTASVR